MLLLMLLQEKKNDGSDHMLFLKQVEERSAEIQLPLGDEHEPLAGGAMGLESGETW